MNKKQRIIFELTPEVQNKIEKLKKSVGVTTNAGLIRYALGLLECVDQYKKEEYTVQFKKDNEVVSIVFPTAIN